MKKIFFYTILAVACTSCGRFGNKDNSQHDQRIVSLAKQYNEIIFSLGAQKDIVAVDISSTYPPAVKKLPTVGYHRALSAEAIIANNPTMIIHDNNIGPEHVVKQLKDLNIPVKTFADSVVTIEQTTALIKEIGAYFHKEKEADSLSAILNTQMNAALQQAKLYKDTPKVVIIHFGQAMNIYMALTAKSNAARMIQWAGGVIPVTGTKGMQPLSAEMIAQADPDVILLTDYGYDRLGSVDKVKDLPGIAGTKAAKHNRIYRVEEHDIIYLGPRTGANVLAFQKLIHGSTD